MHEQYSEVNAHIILVTEQTVAFLAFTINKI